MSRGSSSEAAGFVAEANSSVRPQSLSIVKRVSAELLGLGKKTSHPKASRTSHLAFPVLQSTVTRHLQSGARQRD